MSKKQNLFWCGFCIVAVAIPVQSVAGNVFNAILAVEIAFFAFNAARKATK